MGGLFHVKDPPKTRSKKTNSAQQTNRKAQHHTRSDLTDTLPQAQFHSKKNEQIEPQPETEHISVEKGEHFVIRRSSNK